VFYPVFVIDKIPYIILVVCGVMFMGIGIPIWIISARTIVKGFSEGVLVTDGIYSTCRHPLYGHGIFFTFPGIILFFKSYILLTLPVFMYALFRVLIPVEEKYLEEKFGSAFTNYANSVNMVFPRFWKLLI
jgi:protein-S-isoprenylcysteine O-methyltransferase Ste14